jgi:hypothetical protein
MSSSEIEFFAVLILEWHLFLALAHSGWKNSNQDSCGTELQSGLSQGLRKLIREARQSKEMESALEESHSENGGNETVHSPKRPSSPPSRQQKTFHKFLLKLARGVLQSNASELEVWFTPALCTLLVSLWWLWYLNLHEKCLVKLSYLILEGHQMLTAFLNSHLRRSLWIFSQCGSCHKRSCPESADTNKCGFHEFYNKENSRSHTFTSYNLCHMNKCLNFPCGNFELFIHSTCSICPWTHFDLFEAHGPIDSSYLQKIWIIQIRFHKSCHISQKVQSFA